MASQCLNLQVGELRAHAGHDTSISANLCERRVGDALDNDNFLVTGTPGAVEL
jgi:hypothetical protein